MIKVKEVMVRWSVPDKNAHFAIPYKKFNSTSIFKLLSDHEIRLKSSMPQQTDKMNIFHLYFDHIAI